MQIILFLLGLAFSGVGLWFVGYMLRDILRQQKLEKSGLTVSGVVVGIDQSDGMSAPIVKFTALAGETKQFSSFRMPSCPYTLGQEIAVVYDSDNPDRAKIPSYGGGAIYYYYAMFILFGMGFLGMGLISLAVGLGIITIHPCETSCDVGPIGAFLVAYPRILSGLGRTKRWMSFFSHDEGLNRVARWKRAERKRVCRV